ncbi:4-alpha-glucanotransferase [Stieleria neptunia]|uniref:4-alpha-glucanotransferase n=1 Tax=Stieleria neptunia TaxID=2527979 RepID=A0A518HHR2_9BACT|nr:4-alpha-glucanotransferase [Stieleria neptunia]QDV40386.1 4-alpha-glucanotransferase [Stieleria neptunia]
MTDERQPTPVFSLHDRAAGVLLHVTSLPSRYGIGDFGPESRAWIDWLHDAGQTCWQVLPLGPIGCGYSPYSSLSSFAGNWLMISPDDLVADGLLRAEDQAAEFSPDPAGSETLVDYDAVIALKQRLLSTVWTNFRGGAGEAELRPAYEQFCQAAAHWLDDFAMFSVLRDRHGEHYLQWPSELVHRDPSALAQAESDLATEIDQVRFSQFLVFRQIGRLKAYAHAKGVRLIGDLPFFVSADSSDVWANPEMFLLDEQRQPRQVAGVPPDYFSADGQLWGNPVYDWPALRATGYRWYIDRVRALLAQVDLVRLDHFRGFAAAWHVPAGAPTALSGEWEPGPAGDFFRALQTDLGALPFIAEDLGLITPDVNELRDQFDLPGTRVLQFAFDGTPDNPYLPENYETNSVVYTGTHDNNTTRGWFESLTEDEQETVCSTLDKPGLDGEAANAELLRLAWSSSANLAIAPLQDLLGLGEDARMNVPGTTQGNWRWRATPSMLSESACQRLRDLTEACNRSR